MKTMPSQNKHTKKQGYQLIVLCFGAIVLGCAIPILALQAGRGANNAIVLLSEALGAAILAYVLGAFLLNLKK